MVTYFQVCRESSSPPLVISVQFFPQLPDTVLFHVFDPAKHDLDPVPLFIQIFIVRAGSLPAPSGRDAGPNASGAQGIREPVGRGGSLFQTVWRQV